MCTRGNQFLQDRAERNDAIHALGLEHFDALLPGFGVPRQAGHNQNLQEPVSADQPRRFFDHALLDEPENLRLMQQHARRKDFGVPALDRDHGARDVSEFRGSDFEIRVLSRSGSLAG